MIDLDEIFNRYSMKPDELKDALSGVTSSFDEYYDCEDGFKVVYNEVKGKALYYFPGSKDAPYETTITSEHRNYFVKSGYWRKI